MDNVTIIVSPRERHGTALTSLDSLLQHTPAEVPILYADIVSPPDISRGVAERAAERPIKVRRFDDWIWPTAARRLLVPEVTTPYVVFIDNDVVVEPGWLEALVTCAEETGAGLVGPVYLQGDGRKEGVIHMAGGRVEYTDVDGERHVTEHHTRFGEPRANLAQLSRSKCDSLEFHCMLARMDLLRREGALDPAITTVHEHVDLAIFARDNGYDVYMEPASVITYLAEAPFLINDLATHRVRWNAEEADSSLRAFAAKHGVSDSDLSFGFVRNFVKGHLQRIEPLRPPAAVDRSAPMPASALAQSPTALLRQAAQMGFDAADLEQLSAALTVATFASDGLYRPDGRPFLNHLIGTASVLVHFGFKIKVVIAGLLHALFTHGTARYDVGALTQRLNGFGQEPFDLIIACAAKDRTARLTSKAPERLDLKDAQFAAILAANEADMILSGEAQVTRRGADLSPEERSLVASVLERIDVAGLPLTWLTEPDPLLERLPHSFGATSSVVLDHQAWGARISRVTSVTAGA
jgi:hypothetical protein